MARRHGSLIRPHYPRRNQYGPMWSGRKTAQRYFLESAVGIRQFVGLGIDLAVGVHSDGSDLLLSHGTVHGAGTGGSDGNRIVVS